MAVEQNKYSKKNTTDILIKYIFYLLFDIWFFTLSLFKGDLAKKN